MSQVIINPQEIRIFMSELQQYKQELEYKQQMIVAKLDQLGESWQDQSHQMFREEFYNMIRSMEPYMGKFDEYTSYLNQKATLAEELNNHHF